MSEFKGTPGPWVANCFMVVAPKSHDGMSSVYGGAQICHTGGVGRPGEECEANARVIAASLDMLLALEYVRDYGGKGEIDNEGHDAARIAGMLEGLRDFISRPRRAGERIDVSRHTTHIEHEVFHEMRLRRGAWRDVDLRLVLIHIGRERSPQFPFGSFGKVTLLFRGLGLMVHLLVNSDDDAGFAGLWPLFVVRRVS